MHNSFHRFMAIYKHYWLNRLNIPLATLIKHGTANSTINIIPIFLYPPNATRYANSKQDTPRATDTYGPIEPKDSLMFTITFVPFGGVSTPVKQ